MHAGEGQLAVPGVDHAACLFENGIRGTADPYSAHLGNDAVGTVLVAAVLDLQGAARAAILDGSMDLQKVAGAGITPWLCIGHVPALKAGFEMRLQVDLLIVADDQVGARGADLFGLALGIATGGHHEGARVGPAGAAHGLARVGVPRAGHGAGVYHVHVGFGVEGHDFVSGKTEASLERFDLVEIELAADILESHPPGASRGRRGHGQRTQRTCLIRKTGNRWEPGR